MKISSLLTVDEHPAAQPLFQQTSTLFTASWSRHTRPYDPPLTVAHHSSSMGGRRHQRHHRHDSLGSSSQATSSLSSSPSQLDDFLLSSPAPSSVWNPSSPTLKLDMLVQSATYFAASSTSYEGPQLRRSSLLQQPSPTSQQQPSVFHQASSSFQEVSPSRQTARTFFVSGEKRYACPECSLTFARKNDLCRHYRVHSGEQPYQCQDCSASFKRSDALKRHRDRNVCGGTAGRSNWL